MIKKVILVVRSLHFVAAFIFATMAAHAGVSLPNGVYTDSITDLQVKVQGGMIRIQRDYVDGHWEINNRWNALKFEYDDLDGTVKVIDRSGGKYDKQGDAWMLDTRFVIRQTSVNSLPAAPASLPAAGKPGAGGQALTAIPGYRWQNRTGDWAEYDAEGRMTSYGDRNDNRIWFQYDSSKRLRYLLDHMGRTAIVYTWQGDLITKISDNPGLITGNTDPARSVSYEWNGATPTTPAWPLLTKAFDANNNATTYSYENGRIKTITDAENRVRSFSYLGDRVVKLVEPDGATTQYSYDYDKVKRQFYIKQTHPQTEAGKAIEEYWYDSEGFLIRRDLNGQTQSTRVVDNSSRTRTSKDAAGNATITTLDEYDNPIKVQYADGSFTTARYSAAHGQILEETDELGIKTSYDYDTKGNLLKRTKAVGLPEQRITSYSYDALGRQESVTTQGGSHTLPNGETVTVADVTTRYEYDDFGNLKSKTDAEGNATSYRYNTLGQSVEITDARKYVWQSVYDGMGRFTQRIDPLGRTLTVEYDKTGRMLSQTDPLQHKTRYTLNTQGKIKAITNALDEVITREYDALGRYVGMQDGAGNILDKRSYDLNGRLADTQDGNGNAITNVYDSNGQLTEVRYPTFNRQYGYDQRQRNNKVIEQLSASLSYAQEKKYDVRGNQIETADRQGNKTFFTYDALGRMMKSTDAQGGETRLVYDANYNLLAVTDAQGNTTRYEYDKLGRKTAEINPQGQKQSYAYDANSNGVQYTDAKGNQRQYRYDEASQLVEEKYVPAGSTVPSRTISYNYDAAGGFKGYTEQNATGIALAASYTLDALGRKTAETTTYGNLSFTMATTYHATGRIASQTWPSGFKASYSYDAGQVLQSIDLGSAGSISVNQTRWNTPTKLTYPGGSSQTIDYDALMRTTGIKLSNPGQSTLLDYSYGYDAESNILKKDTEHGQYDYGYDKTYRLTSVTAPSGLPNEAYSYDKVGNRLTDSRRSGDWVYEHNRLKQGRTLSGEVIDYSYDANGSLIKKQSPSGLLEDNQQFVYDASNRLVAVQDSAGQTIARYQYDPFNRRISKTLLRDAQNQALPAPLTTYYLYGDEGLIAEADPNGQITAEYGWKPEGLWGTAPQWLRTTRLGSSAPELLIYQNDHLGTPQQLIDVQGKPVWLARATAFGETTVKTDQVTNNLRFPGQYYDGETNTHYNYHRDYAPNLGRYVQSDPIGLDGGVNAFGYVWGNPVKMIDPAGLSGTAVFPDAWGFPGSTAGPGSSAGVLGGLCSKALGVIGLLLATESPSITAQCNDDPQLKRQECKDNECDNIRSNINYFLDLVKRRHRLMQLDERNLYQRRPTGSDSWAGHRARYTDDQAKLRSWVDRAKSVPCDYDREADPWLQKPAPSRPLRFNR